MKNYVRSASGIIKLFLLMLLVSSNADLSAQNAPQQGTLSVQGVLTRSDGTAVDDGQYPVTFRLFDAPTGGAMVHSEPVTVETIGGVYSVVLGKQSGYPMNAPFDKIYYLSVLIGSTELLPRPQLTHAPYALSILGQSNRFTSTGPILGDAFRVKGGPAIGGQQQGSNGYSFHTIGDDAGGMYSEGGNNIELWAGGTKKIKMTNAVNEFYGQTNTNSLTVYGSLISNDHTTNGNSQVNGWEVVTGDERVEGNQICNKKFLSKNLASGGGYSFVDDTNYDTGMFNDEEGFVSIRTQGQRRFLAYPTGTLFDTPVGDTRIGTAGSFQVSIGGEYFFGGMKAKTGNGTWRNIQINTENGLVQYDNSSRKYKRNIRPLVDDFSLILKAQPRVYNRLDNDTTYNELGYIAEEMDSIGLHNLVQYNSKGVIDGFDYDKMILYTVEVLKTQDAAITQLKAELAALKAENVNLQKENRTLRTDNGF